MATREWSQAEREKAAEELWLESNFCSLVPGQKTEWIEAVLNSEAGTNYRQMLNLKCEVNFLRAQIEEARELLLSAECDRNAEIDLDDWESLRELWMNRNPETK